MANMAAVFPETSHFVHKISKLWC